MPIGHTKESKTFIPQIASSVSITYCDCPGFLDNRGAEINIANAVNIKAAIQQAKSVKTIVLINYHSLKADRGRGITETLKICTSLFGKAENLIAHKGSLLIGITNTPDDIELPDLREWIGQDAPLMKQLTDRIFTFDPLDRPASESGRWTRQELLDHIEQLTPITSHRHMFNTVLISDDEIALIKISERIGHKITQALQTKNYQEVATSLKNLEKLSIIEHFVVERVIQTNTQHIERHFQTLLAQFKDHCSFNRFGDAQTLFQEFYQALFHFPFLAPHFASQDLPAYYQNCYEREFQAREKDRVMQEQLEAARTQIKQFIALLEEQKKVMQAKLEEQQAKHDQQLQHVQNQIATISNTFTREKAQLVAEMALRQKNAEEVSQFFGTQEEKASHIAQEKARLNAEYDLKFKQMEEAKIQALKAQEALKAQQEQDKREMEARLQKQIAVLQAQQAQKIQEMQKLQRPIPSIAFGPADWNKYFGDIGEVPPLPADIDQILEGPCPIWRGGFLGIGSKKVKETHTLVLVPATVNGKPLTLDTIKELVEHPKGGGKATTYSHYWESAKKQLGQTPAPASHWVLMTTDVLPDTRKKTYDAQVAEVKKYRDYEVPRAIDAAAAILMGYVKTGIRWYTDSPWTYTRCQEKVNGYPLGLGGLGSSGLHVNHTSRRRAREPRCRRPPAVPVFGYWSLGHWFGL